jgi:hypothetical protein
LCRYKTEQYESHRLMKQAKERSEAAVQAKSSFLVRLYQVAFSLLILVA